MCCGIPAGLIDRYVLLHIHSYEQPAPDSIGNVAITVDVNPQERIQGPPERLLGPPYALSVMLRDPTRSAVEAKLHSFHMRLPDGQTIAGNISVNHSKWKEGLELTILHVQFKTTSWGGGQRSSPTLKSFIPIEASGRLWKYRFAPHIAAIFMSLNRAAVVCLRHGPLFHQNLYGRTVFQEPN
jgi:hypothetical protein